MIGIEGDSASGDRRVRKTKKALRDALVELILEKGYSAVSVQDVVDRADVGRTTFYAHFTDKDDLLFSGFAEFHAAAGHPGPAAGLGGLMFVIRDMLRHGGEERRLYRAVFGRGGAGPLQSQLEQQLSSYVEGIIRNAKPAADPAAVAMASRMSAVAFLGLVGWWLDGNDEVPAARVADAFESFVMPGLDRLLA
jgi:AcrR family transcriptional regulator